MRRPRLPAVRLLGRTCPAPPGLALLAGCANAPPRSPARGANALRGPLGHSGGPARGACAAQPPQPTADAEGATVSGPLDDIVVIDLSRALAGPHAAMMLGDLGARVIKVETPGSGDDTRGWGPPFVGPEDDPHLDLLPVVQPQQGVDHPRPQVRRRPRDARPARRRRPTCSSRTSGPASSTGSASRSSGCTSSTRASSCSRSAGSATTAPRVAGPATTRSPRARRA